MGKKIVFIIVGVIAIGGTLFLIFGRNLFLKQQNILSTQTQILGVPTIVKAIMSRSIDAKGNATGETAVFNTKTDKIVYIVLTLKNVTKNTKLSYTRYLNGNYIDSKVAEPSKDDITNFYFTFEKGIGNYSKGTYTVKLYVDGRRIANLAYVFK